MNKPAFDPSAFAANTAKPLPLILLLDVSESMSEVVDGSFARTGQTVFRDGQTWELVQGGVTRIELLNRAVRKMLATLAKEEASGASEFLVTVITFGAEAKVALPPTRATGVRWVDLTTAGETPLGAALAVAKQVVEDKDRTPARAWRPTVVLVSDGKPTDVWENPLAEFTTLGRSAKCDRMAMAAGPKADMAVLGRFVDGTGHEVFQADQADRIQEFFRRVTMSVVARSVSKNPNLVPLDRDLRLDGVSRPVPPSPAPSADADDGYW